MSTIMLLVVLPTSVTLPVSASVSLPQVLVGAHYFGGWYNCSGYPAKTCGDSWTSKRCPWNSTEGCLSVGEAPMFGGISPNGLIPTTNFFDFYPSRRPLLGSLTSLEATVAAEIKAADRALSFFDVLFYDGSALCGHPDPNLAWCLNSALAFMLNSSSAWDGVERLHFFITYSNDIDAATRDVFVGAAGEMKWVRFCT